MRARGVRHAGSGRAGFLWLFAVVSVALTGVGCPGDEPGADPAAPESAPIDPEWERTYEGIEAVEDGLRELAAPLQRLSRGIRGLDLSGDAPDLPWGPTVTLRDVSGGATPDADQAALSLQRLHWNLAEASSTVPRAELDPWRPLFADVARFDTARFGTKRGRFLDSGELDVDLKFSATAWHRDGRVLQLDGKIHSGWRKIGEGETATWRLDRLEWESLHGLAGADLLFEEVLDRVLADPAVRREARRSRHEEALQQMMAAPKDKRKEMRPHPQFQVVSGQKHPGLAVVDIDADGWDDLYVMPRIGRNQLLRNRGDGTFEEVAARYGLDIENHCTGAVFADFDNDGDLDVVVGRTIGPSRYLMNEDGRYVDRADHISVPLPEHVTGVSAADVNGDGLLDLYLSTYLASAQKILWRMKKRSGSHKSDEAIKALSRVLPEAHARGIAERLDTFGVETTMQDRPGPPNLLLYNQGAGRFVAAAPGGAHEIWRNTLQAAFADIDDDGDQDLYVANDFAPNNFLRNDGKGVFEDITAQTNTLDEGFGMGASWGDYDADGDLDLYVTNMYSKAGRRITGMMGDKGTKYAHLARGNSLLQCGDGLRFERVSGMKRPAMEVEAAGWGWGGQFLDVDNDGWLDIYAGAGFYTAPPGFRSLVDT